MPRPRFHLAALFVLCAFSTGCPLVPNDEPTVDCWWDWEQPWFSAREFSQDGRFALVARGPTSHIVDTEATIGHDAVPDEATHRIDTGLQGVRTLVDTDGGYLVFGTVEGTLTTVSVAPDGSPASAHGPLLGGDLSSFSAASPPGARHRVAVVWTVYRDAPAGARPRSMWMTVLDATGTPIRDAKHLGDAAPGESVSGSIVGAGTAAWLVRRTDPDAGGVLTAMRVGDDATTDGAPIVLAEGVLNYTVASRGDEGLVIWQTDDRVSSHVLDGANAVATGAKLDGLSWGRLVPSPDRSGYTLWRTRGGDWFPCPDCRVEVTAVDREGRAGEMLWSIDHARLEGVVSDADGFWMTTSRDTLVDENNGATRLDIQRVDDEIGPATEVDSETLRYFESCG